MFARPFLGDLIPKGERCGSKQGVFPRRRCIFQMGKIPSESSQHEGEVAR